MPELPEVETVKEALKQTVKGRQIKDIEIRYEPMIKNMTANEFKKALINQTIQDISRRGKYLVLHFDDYQLLSHLRMEGKYFYVEDHFELNPHVHVIFTLTPNDTRK